MSAVISDCGTYRYWLERYPTEGLMIDLSDTDQDRANTMIFVMANPSTADATKDDPTIRKCVGFAKRHGYPKLVVVNVMAARATYPDDLLTIPDPVGPENESYLRKAGSPGSFNDPRIVLAWGNAIAKPLRRYIPKALAALSQNGSGGLGNELYCFGYTKDRQPRHPLMLAYTTPLEIYKP